MVWSCDQCTLENEDGVEVCGACESPKKVGNGEAAGSWNCRACTFLNGPDLPLCAVCETPHHEVIDLLKDDDEIPKKDREKEEEEEEEEHLPRKKPKLLGDLLAPEDPPRRPASPAPTPVVPVPTSLTSSRATAPSSSSSTSSSSSSGANRKSRFANFGSSTTVGKPNTSAPVSSSPASLSTSPASLKGASSITFLFWNIWFEPNYMLQRMEAIAKVIAEKEPDFICLQEVTHESLQYLFSSPSIKKYPLKEKIRPALGYFTVILSKHQVKGSLSLPVQCSSSP